ncbi:MAG TPA: acylneuraminate cytidylyltransferase family protein [Niastella sp.]
MNILITICARGGSKGIPGKNTRLLNGIPLIAYSIKTAEKFAAASDNFVHIGLSTDSEEILQTASEHGLPSNYIRPAELATDSAGKLGVIRDILNFEEKQTGKHFDYIIDLDVTSPLRTVSDLNTALAQMIADTTAHNIFSVNVANRNPYFNMVEQKEDGYFGLSKKGRSLTRQSAPAVYELNASFYIYRHAFFSLDVPTPISDKSMIYIMPHTCFDLDHPIDFEFMEFLLQHNKLDFEI